MFMKKLRLLSILTAFVLTLSAVPCGLATQQDPPGTSAPTEPAPPVATTAPVEPEPTMPPAFQGDASVEYGSLTLDAQRPLNDKDDYTGQVKAALLYDLGSDTLVFAQDIDVRLYPASLTKVMTALLTIEMQPDLDVLATVPAEALKGQDPGGSNVALKVDEQMSVRNLLYCLMVKSGNDAASTLAIHNSGSVAAFVEAMNRKAEELGCTGTHFANPHGLHDDEHYTTARDMAKITAAAMQYPIFEKIFTTTEYTVPATNLSDARELATTNYLIRSNGYPVVVDTRVLGGKTGNTSKAGRCLVALSEKDGTRLLSVVLGAKATYGENGYGFVRYGNFEETTSLLNFAYKQFTTMQVLNPTLVGTQFPVSGGDHNAFGSIREEMSAAVPIGCDFNTIRYEYTLIDGGLTAPVQKGDKIGTVRVWYDNICLAQQDLLSADDVDRAKKVPTATVTTDDESVDLWNGILKIVLGVVAGLFVLVLVIRMVNTIRYRRRRRRKAHNRRR